MVVAWKDSMALSFSGMPQRWGHAAPMASVRPGGRLAAARGDRVAAAGGRSMPQSSIARFFRSEYR
jgi:hypothetical protein